MQVQSYFDQFSYYLCLNLLSIYRVNHENIAPQIKDEFSFKYSIL